jgi:hypothetical protein
MSMNYLTRPALKTSRRAERGKTMQQPARRSPVRGAMRCEAKPRWS